MSATYKATGINLKSMPLGETDRLLTILTREFGLIRAVAPASRKHQSKLAGRSALFVVNELLIAKGRSLDKITQAETIESYPGLSQDLAKLTAGQYLAEVVLCHALSEQPQEELFCLLSEHLSRLEQLSTSTSDSPLALVLAHLSHAIFHLLALAGIAPQVHLCCVTQQPLQPNFSDPDWQVGFSVAAGGVVSLEALASLNQKVKKPILNRTSQTNIKVGVVAEVANHNYQTDEHLQAPPKLNMKLGATELALLQQLAQPQLTQFSQTGEEELTLFPEFQTPLLCVTAWGSVEQILRQYIQYHFGRTIRSAALMDTCFSAQINSP